ncbi:hypothetical protein TRFO_31992 [Tritrichomonas foetus]|uniref:Uncharacterized protein n=1 Tax=Tritrichomonas foetus TaxID=1144522 RepID=A0A1J4JUP9_9EUKA|nr:hypothetical protein TRFO_31992 [Tritrichomonas foetus]|eukprot:OHT01246.1 hypothetical protein TRFO_31992 [Tritrichomonas foetus]
MSLNSLLNGSAPKPVRSAVTRVVRSRVISQNDEPKASNHVAVHSFQEKNSKPQPVKHETPRQNEDILTFTIVAKIYLPKEVADRLDMLFMKFLQCKVSFQTLSGTIVKSVTKYPIVLQLWNVILNRNSIVTDPLAIKVKEIVGWFLANSLQPILCIHFVKFVVDAKQNGLSRIKIFCALIENESSLYPPSAISDLLKFALELYPILPHSIFPPLSHVDKNSSTSIPEAFGIKRKTTEFLMSTRDQDASASLPKKQSKMNNFINSGTTNNNIPSKHHGGRHSAPPPIKYTPSHNRNLINLPNSATSFFFNFLTKSTQTGQEGGSHPPPHHHVEAPPPTRDLHELLESMEVLEHAIDEIESFDTNIPVYNFVIYAAGKYIYGKSWQEIEKYLPNKHVREFIIERCRGFLETIYDDLLEAQHFSRGYLETQPTNGFICQLNPPSLKSSFRIHFTFYETNISNYLKSIILSHPVADKHKYTNLNWFVRKVLPRFQVADPKVKNTKKYEIFGPKSLACALWYFSLLCKTIAPIFSSDALQTKSWDAVLDNATEDVKMKYLIEGERPFPRKILTRVLKSIIANRTIIDEIADEVVKHFGMLSQNIANFYLIFSRLNRAASWLRNDPHKKLLWKCFDAFGVADGVNADQELYAKRPLYKKMVMFPSKEKMYLFKFEIEKETIHILPAF